MVNISAPICSVMVPLASRSRTFWRRRNSASRSACPTFPDKGPARMRHGDRPSLRRRLTGLFSVRNRIAKVVLALVGIRPLLAKRPSNAYPYSALEMLRLYTDMRRRKPDTVMEFGVGASTITIAVALQKNGHGRLITVDGSEEWIAVCRDSLPESLSRYVE